MIYIALNLLFWGLLVDYETPAFINAFCKFLRLLNIRTNGLKLMVVLFLLAEECIVDLVVVDQHGEWDVPSFKMRLELT